MRLVANIISIIFHPLLMITYGVILALTFTYLAIYPISAKMLIMGGVFTSSAFIPGLFILMMVKAGSAKDLELTDRRDRLIPYLVMVISNISCLFFMYKMMMPYWMMMLMIAAIVSLVIALCINFYWKISAHLLGIGALLGAVLGICRMQMTNAWSIFIIGFIIAGLLGTSRIILGKHTPMQVYAGFSLGFTLAFVSSFLSFIYLFN